MILFMWQRDISGVARLIGAYLEKCTHQLAIPWGIRHLISSKLAWKDAITIIIMMFLSRGGPAALLALSLKNCCQAQRLSLKLTMSSASRTLSMVTPGAPRGHDHLDTIARALKILVLLRLILSVCLASRLMGCCSLPSHADKFKAAQHRMQADSVALCKRRPSRCLTVSCCNLAQTLTVPSRLIPLALHCSHVVQILLRHQPCHCGPGFLSALSWLEQM